MRVNLAFQWDLAPAKGRFEFVNARCFSGVINVGWGTFDKDTLAFTFTSTQEMCRLVFGVDTDNLFSDSEPPELRVHDLARPVRVPLREVLKQKNGELRLAEHGLTLTAQLDTWSDPGPGDEAATNPAAVLPVLFKTFTDEQRKQFGPVRRREVLRTVRHVYTSPFLYDNVTMGDFYEIDPTKGVELKADSGYITIHSEKPIVSVRVVGSGCNTNGYNICEWWADGESIDNMKDQLVKRQRIDNLNGIHPMILYQLLMSTFPGLTFRDVLPDPRDVRNPVDCLKKLSHGFYGGMFMGFYENTADFRVGPPYPNQVTIRGGSLSRECPGVACFDEYPAHYAFRVIELEVIETSS